METKITNFLELEERIAKELIAEEEAFKIIIYVDDDGSLPEIVSIKHEGQRYGIHMENFDYAVNKNTVSEVLDKLYKNNMYCNVTVVMNNNNLAEKNILEFSEVYISREVTSDCIEYHIRNLSLLCKDKERTTLQSVKINDCTYDIKILEIERVKLSPITEAY